MRALIVFLTAFSIFGGNVYSQEPNWYLKIKQLGILLSSKQDVVRVFGLENDFANDPQYFQRNSWYFDVKERGEIEAFFYESLLRRYRRGLSSK